MIEGDFAAVIADDYGSDAPRLGFADWLLERGEECRAELIRIQCTLARTENQPRTPELSRLFSRQTQLQPFMTALLKGACADLPPYVTLRFERGLIQNVEADTALFAAEASVIAERTPFFMKLLLRGGVVVVPELARVRSLQIDGEVSSVDLGRVLDVSPLYALDLRPERLDNDAVALLAVHPAATRLRQLSLTTITHVGASRLATSTQLATLERLVLFRVGGARGAQALATATWADTIHELVIHKKALDDDSRDMLHARFGDRVRTYPIAT